MVPSPSYAVLFRRWIKRVFVWGAQLSRFLPNIAHTNLRKLVSRSADIASVSGTASADFKDTEIVVDVQMPKGWKDKRFNRFYSFNDGLGGNAIISGLTAM